ncbi:hypothetical protein PAXRUDRAFT_16747 [Paxillus rubicundulus Ve08.2h10]|uniref:Uncharacterized protein n=1 Tax=Paxillus rubicundulus Ve08.2h10 TaxID=930991 RepID=A0A0D0CTE3_9AGAM|nr:hypothetical protein PAXRUDRAFT_16747 [Paxillus rubicundulus Ve08.2h10]
MAVIAINKILDQVWAKYLPGDKVPSLVITAEMKMFLIDQPPKSILKGKGADPLEHGGGMAAGGRKVEGKQAWDNKQGVKDGEKGKKKKGKKEKKKEEEKEKERLEKGPDGGKESGCMASDLGGSAAGVEARVGDDADETRGQSWESVIQGDTNVLNQGNNPRSDFYLG